VGVILACALASLALVAALVSQHYSGRLSDALEQERLQRHEADKQRTRAEDERAEAEQQRATAEEQRVEADMQRSEAESQRMRAEGQEALARSYLYYSEIKLAAQAWQEAHLERMDELLARQMPARAGQRDLRSFDGTPPGECSWSFRAGP
jgi:hypothetical protein